jgi:hypothetical protein
MRKKVGTSTYIQRINTLERKLLKQVKELDDIMQKHPEIMFRLQVVEFALKHSVKLAVEAFGQNLPYTDGLKIIKTVITILYLLRIVMCQKKE